MNVIAAIAYWISARALKDSNSVRVCQLRCAVTHGVADELLLVVAVPSVLLGRRSLAQTLVGDHFTQMAEVTQVPNDLGRISAWHGEAANVRL